MAMKRTPPLTADEFTERLNASPETIVSAKERFERIQQDAAEYRREAEPVVSALRDARINTSSIRGASKDKKSIPVLLEHLQKAYPTRVLWSIAVALATPAASYAWPILVAEYKKSSNIPGESMGPKDGLANALVATVTKDTIDELIALVKDPLQGSSTKGHSEIAHAPGKARHRRTRERPPARQGDRILAAAETTSELIKSWKS